MSSTIDALLVQKCLEKMEPCVPVFGGESWFSVAFVAEIMGYDNVKYFTEQINKANVPRHQFQKKCIRFSDVQ